MAITSARQSHSRSGSVTTKTSMSSFGSALLTASVPVMATSRTKGSVASQRV